MKYGDKHGQGTLRSALLGIDELAAQEAPLEIEIEDPELCNVLVWMD